MRIRRKRRGSLVYLRDTQLVLPIHEDDKRRRGGRLLFIGNFRTPVKTNILCGTTELRFPIILILFRNLINLWALWVTLSKTYLHRVSTHSGEGERIEDIINRVF